MTAIVTRGDAAHLHLPDESVDLIVTSPPYYSLRSYLDGGEHYAGQVGDEPTPIEYLDALIACTREWVRVLKPGGSLFVNLGDKYSGYQNRPDTHHKEVPEGSISRGQWLASQVKDPSIRYTRNAPDAYGIPYKSLMGLPWRYALRCIDELGLILRAEVIWSKPNGLPESVTDRVRRSHEQLFHLTRRPRYYCATDEVREETTRVGLTWEERKATGARTYSPDNGHMSGGPGMAANPLGKLPGSVWEITTAPLTVPDWRGVERGRIVRYFAGTTSRVDADAWLRAGGARRRSVRPMADHFAAYPPELVRRIVLGWSPREVCAACGEGRRPVSDSEQILTQKTYSGRPPTAVGREDCRSGPPRVTLRTVTGYACGCLDTDAPSTPGVVLDPFGGTGTTALVASVFGRVGISVDLSADYCRLARWRTTDPGERARALKVPKPPVQVNGQLGLFDDLEPVPRLRGASSSLPGGRARDCTACGYRTQYSNWLNCEKCGAERAAS